VDSACGGAPIVNPLLVTSRHRNRQAKKNRTLRQQVELFRWQVSGFGQNQSYAVGLLAICRMKALKNLRSTRALSRDNCWQDLDLHRHYAEIKAAV